MLLILSSLEVEGAPLPIPKCAILPAIETRAEDVEGVEVNTRSMLRYAMLPAVEVEGDSHPTLTCAMLLPTVVAEAGGVEGAMGATHSTTYHAPTTKAEVEAGTDTMLLHRTGAEEGRWEVA
jgi:hypothetical protein